MSIIDAWEMAQTLRLSRKSAVLGANARLDIGRRPLNSYASGGSQLQKESNYLLFADLQKKIELPLLKVRKTDREKRNYGFSCGYDKEMNWEVTREERTAMPLYSLSGWGARRLECVPIISRAVICGERGVIYICVCIESDRPRGLSAEKPVIITVRCGVRVSAMRPPFDGMQPVGASLLSADNDSGMTAVEGRCSSFAATSILSRFVNMVSC
ncbi:hypothetical protein DFH29DRAFT_964305 [Suillus ampliporus]|nr:hypothetical protein DFH29DRAFT_964305 [Suillus ampliporus]